MGRAPRPRLRRHRALPRPRHRGLFRSLARGRASVRGGARSSAADRRPRARLRLRHPDRRAERGSRSTCAVCGLSKRYVFNRAALEGGFDVVATGHNLDDEAATLLGNTLRWQTDAIARQSPSSAPPSERDGQEGQASPSPVRARDGRLRLLAWHRLRGRGVPARRREHAAPIQGSHERDRADLAGDQGTVLPRVSGARHAAVPVGGSGGASPLRVVRPTHHGSLLRVLPGSRADPRSSVSAPTGADREPSDREIAEELSDEVLPAEIYAGPSDERAVRSGREGPPHRPARADVPVLVAGRRHVPHPRGHARARRPHRPIGGDPGRRPRAAWSWPRSVRDSPTTS